MPTQLWTYLFLIPEALALLTILSILRRRREPRAMLAWILALLLLPVLGLALYLIASEPRWEWHRRRRRRRRRRLIRAFARKGKTFRSPKLKADTERLDPTLEKLAWFARRLGARHATGGNEVRIFYDAEKTFEAIRGAIEAARSHVHLEYYIFQPDETGRAIRDLLIAKAREGVQCRVLLDYAGCWRMPRSFVRAMRGAGVAVAFAMPVIPWRGRWRVNYRNHRKIAVIDGRVGFTGSQNIGDEYRGRLSKYGPWRDTHLKIEGAGVHDLQEVFIEDWHYTTRQDLASDEFFPGPDPAGDHTVQIVPSGPDQPIHVMHQLLFAAVSAAQSSISVITPYFVPDGSMVLAFQSAAYRGVHVRLIVPTCTDHLVVLWAGRSYYDELRRAGIEIYEEEHTMLHSKVVIVDQSWALVGSANMDERSFRLNFELTTILYGRQLAGELYEDFEAIRASSRLVRPDQDADRSYAAQYLMGLARLASPVL